MIIQGINLRKKAIFTYLISEGAGFVVGSIFLLIMTALVHGGIMFDEDYTVAHVGTMFAMTIFFITYLIGGLVELKLSFNTSIGFGMTRKKFFIQELTSTYLYTLVGVVLLGALFLIEKGILQLAFYRKYEYEVLFTNEDFITILLVALICVPVAKLFLGSVLLKFGKNKGFWVIWALWMIFCLSPSFISEIMHNGPQNKFQTAIYNIIISLQTISIGIWVAIGVLILVVCLAISWLLIKNKEVE